MYCPYCGATLPQDSTVCPYCGVTVKNVPTQARRAAPVPEYIPDPAVQKQPQNPSQRKNHLPAILAVILAAILIIGAAIALICVLRPGSADPEIRWQDQYDLGSRFLSEGNYEAAALAFCAAIEIEPKRSEAYIGAAEAYIALGNLDAAEDILAKYEENTGESLLDQLENLIDKWLPKPEPEPETEPEPMPGTEPEPEPESEPERKLVKILETDNSGHDAEYRFIYNQKNQLSEIQYYWDGSRSYSDLYFYDEEDRYIRKTVGGESYDVYVYDSEGKKLQWSETIGDFRRDHFYHYDDQGILTSETLLDYFRGPEETEEIIYLCDAQNKILEEHYEDGSSFYFTYDDQGRVLRETSSTVNTSFLEYDYENYKPFVAGFYSNGDISLVLQDSVGGIIWVLSFSLGIDSVQADEEGYILSAQNSHFKYTFFYEESTQAS